MAGERQISNRKWWACGACVPLCCADELRANLQRIYSWRIPPNWSPTDWRQEIGAVAVIAAWEAEQVFDPSYGIPVNAFVRSRVLACALARYRKEWAFATRCVFNRGPEEDEASGGRADRFLAHEVESNPACEALMEALAGIAPPRRALIRQLFWEERTEAEIGRDQGISQRAVSKRKQAALRSLGQRLNA